MQIRKQVIQDGRIVYQDFGDNHSPSSNSYPADSGYSSSQQSSFPPPIYQAPTPPPVMPAHNNGQETEVVTSTIYVHPFVWLFGLLVFTVMMTGLLRPTVIMPYGGGGTTNNFVLPGAGGQ
jgi:hypothetical protein